MSFLETLWDDVETAVKNDAAYVEAAVSSFFHAEATALKPIVETALTNFAAAVSTNPTPAGVAAAAGSAWASVGSQLEGTVITTGISTLITSMTTGMASAVAATTAPAAVPAAAPAIGS